MKAKPWILSALAVFLIAILVSFAMQKSHTFTLSDNGPTIKLEQIQPLWGAVSVSGDQDTDVVFTDIETGERYIIGYITNGVTEKIKLKKGRWYQVEGRGALTVGPVKVRVA